MQKNKKKLDYKTLRLSDNYQYSSEEEQEEEKEKQDKKVIDVNKFNESIIKEETKINKELLNKHFHYQTPSALLKDLYNTNNKEKNSLLLSVINSGIKDLKEQINKMFEKERQIEKPDEMVEIGEEILKFNEQNREGKDSKMLTPNQMLSRLPISLDQLEAGNNSENIKNEIRQLLYSLYRSKNMTKQVYNNLIKYI